LLGQRIDHHVTRAGVERDHVIKPRTRWERGQVGDASEIQRHPPDFCVPVEKMVEVRHQRGPFTPRRHIRRAEVRYHRHAQPRGNARSFTHLPGGGQLAPQKNRRASLMI